MLEQKERKQVKLANILCKPNIHHWTAAARHPVRI